MGSAGRGGELVTWIPETGPRAACQEKPGSQEPGTRSPELVAMTQERGTRSREPGAGRQEPRAENPEARAQNLELLGGSGEPRGSRSTCRCGVHPETTLPLIHMQKKNPLCLFRYFFACDPGNGPTKFNSTGTRNTPQKPLEHDYT